jgi:hypothetical protein
MAKKMLINADMLLATPRRNDPIEVPIHRVEAEKIQMSPAIEVIKTPQKGAVTELVVPIESPKQQPTLVVKKMAEVTSVQRGLKVGETRATFIVKEDTLEKIKAIAYWDRENIKDVMQVAMDNYIKEYENAHGAVKPVP